MLARGLTVFAVTAGLMAALPAIQAQERGTGATGIAFATGGVGESDQQQLQDERTRYTFWLTTAARGSGAYLAGATVRIIDLNAQKLVLEATLEGPWLLAALPAGRYALQAQYRGLPTGAAQSQRQTLTIGHRGLRRMVLYFDVNDPVERAPGTAQRSRQ